MVTFDSIITWKKQCTSVVHRTCTSSGLLILCPGRELRVGAGLLAPLQRVPAPAGALHARFPGAAAGPFQGGEGRKDFDDFQILRGLFSAVSTPIFAVKYSVD